MNQRNVGGVGCTRRCSRPATQWRWPIMVAAEHSSGPSSEAFTINDCCETSAGFPSIGSPPNRKARTRQPMAGGASTVNGRVLDLSETWRQLPVQTTTDSPARRRHSHRSPARSVHTYIDLRPLAGQPAVASAPGVTRLAKAVAALEDPSISVMFRTRPDCPATRVHRGRYENETVSPSSPSEP